jgi:CrcB protein
MRMRRLPIHHRRAFDYTFRIRVRIVMDTLIKYFCVGSAGFVGAIARYFVGATCNSFLPNFPVGTMLINLSGSFILGWFAAYAAARVVPEPLRLAVAVGFVGAYTTFSTFMFESDALLRDGEWRKALINLLGSVILGMIAVRFGWRLGTR